MLASFEKSFADALLNPDGPVPDGLITYDARIPARRFAVYRNNVVVTLSKALKSRFPAVDKIVGEDFFGAMARVFVTERPPRSPLLATYGDEFADFITTFEPAIDLPYLADVARLEAARTRAHHSADAVPIDADRLTALDPSKIADIRIDLHPSVEIVRSQYPVFTIWAMNSGEQELAPIEDWRGEDALVARPGLDVEIRALPLGGAAFLVALAENRPFGEAAEAALADNSDFDLIGNLAGLIGSGLVRDIALPQPTEHGQP